VNKITGVYAIRCTANGKVYVGSTSRSFAQRWNNHRNKLRKQSHENIHLQAAWDKYPEESFEFLVIEECLPPDCIAREQFWIEEMDAVDRSSGFNMAPTAGSALGFRHSEETRAKMSAAHQNPTPEYRARMSAIKRGEIRSPETRLKMSLAARGRKASAETRAKIGVASGMRSHGPEARAKMSIAHKGRKKSDETRAKMSAAVRRRWAAKRSGEALLLPFMNQKPWVVGDCEVCGKEFERIRRNQKVCHEDCRLKHKVMLARQRKAVFA
jgi:group I intron endonuclease